MNPHTKKSLIGIREDQIPDRAALTALLDAGLVRHTPAGGFKLTSLARFQLRTGRVSSERFRASGSQRKILAAIAVAGELATPAIERFVQGSIGPFRRGVHLEGLRNHGWIRETRHRRGRMGRPAIIWQITPAGAAEVLGI